MSTHFKGPLIVAESGSVIPGLLADGTCTTLTVASDGTVGGDLAVTGETTAGSLAVGGGTEINKIVKGSVSVVVPAAAGGTNFTITAALTGAVVGDSLILNMNNAADESALVVCACWVSAPDQISISAFNNSGGPLTGSTTNWDYCLIRV